ncbi:hypothetical protein [Bifidobacterium aquikefiri]|uniref:hypothetical protein n=1 Tax=Bifidobacterium aquikefiri TaxID=1653207 RepID=UPI0039E7B999
MSDLVIPSDAVVCVDRFSGALVHGYMARMIPSKPVYFTRADAMEATRKYLNHNKKVA